MDTRHCKKCDQHLPIERFHRSRTRTPGYTCIECANLEVQRRLQPRQDAVRAIKLEAGCARCGYREHWAALDFDHGPGIKASLSDAISKMVTRTSIPLDDLVAAARACTVLCSNCHRIVTWERKQTRPRRSAVTDDELYLPKLLPYQRMTTAPAARV